MPAVQSNGAPRSARSAELARGRAGDQDIAERLALALEETQEALAQLQRIAIEEIRDGLEASDHVEAAERKHRSMADTSVGASAYRRSGKYDIWRVAYAS